MKTPEELNALKAEIEAMNKKLAELNEEELKQVIGGTGEEPDKGIFSDWCPYCGEGADFHLLKNIHYSGSYREFWHCGKCGDMTHIKSPDHWEHGIITV